MMIMMNQEGGGGAGKQAGIKQETRRLQAICSPDTKSIETAPLRGAVAAHKMTHPSEPQAEPEAVVD